MILEGVMQYFQNVFCNLESARAPAELPLRHFHVYYAGFQRPTGIDLAPDFIYNKSTTAIRKQQ